MSKRPTRRGRQQYLDEENGGNGGNGGNGWRRPSFEKKPMEVVVSAKTQGQKRYIIEIKNNDITFCVGPAGCGKTAIAVGIALQDVLSANPTYQKIVVMRPVKEACDEHIGFLPGDLSDKMGPWGAPIVDNMAVFIDSYRIRALFAAGVVEVVPMAYARGRSFNNSFIIVDEAQNCTPRQMLMILTRMGVGSKLVINGDVSQNDTTGLNGLVDAFQRLRGIDGVSFVQLHSADIVRNGIISEIIERYSDSVPSSIIEGEDEGDDSPNTSG